MAHRKFRDAFGIEWQAWDVRPQWGERRLGSDRRAVERSRETAGGSDRRGGDRRARQRRRSAESGRPRVGLSPGLASGWLAFESKRERRRLVPIPDNWDTLPDDRLAALCDSATPAAKRRLAE